ncbi:T9SS type A sorting domain-containing protein [Seonamhaeicola sediminis]|uniref:T9SS type A sorting domain-containing protein n=1 Tax=Seonamhaeicola sediminis TaxID=2528206 RepID=A0A562YFC9_9FLAO|nr:T9SS type A sorting domain-containing protein [Seonamhaeicola sediminis]TWO33420.1 T9SS type A sorting domain-containing protein [Seonamhaeicola sediminis]
MKKITLLNLLFVLCAFYGFSQTVVNNFEDISPTVTTQFGVDFSVVSNPNTTGNTSTNCGKLGRTTSNWYELITFPITAYNVPANTTRYLHVMVNYPAQPDVSVRFDASDADINGATDIRALNSYTNFNQWQDLVFQIDGGASGATVEYIVYLHDIGYQNSPAGRILNNTDAFAYIDNFTFSDSDVPLLSNKDFELSKNISLYPNPVKSTFSITSNNGVKISKVSVYNALGAKVAVNPVLGSDKYDISSLASGMYLVKISDDKGAVTTKRLLKQ